MGFPNRKNSATTEDRKIEQLVTRALRDAVAGQLPSAHIWQRIQRHIAVSKRRPWHKRVATQLGLLPFSRLAMLFILLLVFGIGTNYHLARRETISNQYLVSRYWGRFPSVAQKPVGDLPFPTLALHDWPQSVAR